MKIIRSSAIGEAIRNMAMRKIAVAYLGSGWKTYVKYPENLEYIVISTDIGTNPGAVASLVAEIGWDKVFLFDQLHAKIYVGDGAAMIGSANLSDNGLSGDGLEEIAATFSDKAAICELGEIADQIQKKAKQQYPSPERKDDQLREMQRRWNRSLSNERHHEASDTEAHDILAYPFSRNPLFWVMWYQSGSIVFDEKLVHEKTVGSLSEIKEHGTYTHVLPNDAVKEGDWLLLWRAKNNGLPYGRGGGLFWRYTHRLVSGAVTNWPEYTTGVFELPGAKKPRPPFELTSETRQAIVAALKEDRFKNLRPDGEMGWDAFHCGGTKALLPSFIKTVQDKS